MSVLLQQNRGRLSVIDGTAAPAVVKGGIPYGPTGAVAIDLTGAIDHHHQGLPYTASGRLAAVEGNPVRYNMGAMPLDADGRLCLFITGFTNLYVNPELAGGGVDTPCTGHVIAFNTNGANYTADPARPGFFRYQSNTQDINGRSPQQYDVKANNPTLVVGNTYRFGYTVTNFSGINYGAAINAQAVTSLTIVNEQRRSFPNVTGQNLFVDFTIDAADWTLSVRAGCGTTADNSWRGEVYKPILIDITGGSGDAVAWNGGLAYTVDGALIAITQDP